MTPTPTGPTPTQGASGSGATTATCNFTTDRSKLTEVINAVNAYRARRSLPAYTVNTQLAQAAQRHANDIACHKLYVHTGTDGSTAQSRVRDSGYVAKSVSENVNGNYPPLDGEAVVNWWINDKTDLRHGRNLVSDTFTEIGIRLRSGEELEADIVVTGMNLDDPMDGVELVSRLRHHDCTRSTPIIVLTACVWPKERVRAEGAGCDVFLPKPCLPNDLLGEVQQLLTATRSQTAVMSRRLRRCATSRSSRTGGSHSRATRR